MNKHKKHAAGYGEFVVVNDNYVENHPFVEISTILLCCNEHEIMD